MFSPFSVPALTNGMMISFQLRLLVRSPPVAESAPHQSSSFPVAFQCYVCATFQTSLVLTSTRQIVGISGDCREKLRAGYGHDAHEQQLGSGAIPVLREVVSPASVAPLYWARISAAGIAQSSAATQ